MDCPECHGDITKVVLTRQLHQGAETGTLRRHACLDCGRRWFSFQPPPQVVPNHRLEHHDGTYWLRS